MNVNSLPVCIIGAGSSGIATAKALKEKNVSFDCFEIGSNIGGMWRYENDNGLSSAYRSLHIDTSRDNLGYSDFPIPKHYPQFMSHFEVIRFFESYVEHFKLRPHITFNTRVTNVEREASGAWRVTLDSAESRLYRAVIVANGHLWDPRYPGFRGEFAGNAIHSHYYRTSEPYRDKNVLVVGIGNSAVDIAVDVCKQAKRTFLSTRRSAWIMPKYIMGIPVDKWSGFMNKKLMFPTKLTRTVMRFLMYIAVGDQSRYGVPKPQHAIWREHATLSQELLPFAGHGWLKVKPNVSELLGNKIRFDDGSEEQVDEIIYATGYKTTFPFINPDLFKVEDGSVELYRRMLPPELPGLYMVGLVQPIGPTIPLVEVQARWLASVLAGETRLPERKHMHEEIQSHLRDIRKRYVGSARYTLEVDFRDYAKMLWRDMKAGLAGA